MHKLVMFATAAIAAAAPAIAHADHDLSRPVRLAEVSADPRDGNDTVRLGGLSRFTHLELRAREASVRIRDLGLRFHDGSVEWLNVRARLAPGEQRSIELPPLARRAEALVVDYGDPELRRRDRTPARLELYGAIADGRFDDRYGERYSDRYDRRVDDRRRADRWEHQPVRLAPNDGWH
ncbi:MAG TPA: hypothetical protein VNO30_35410 [Kofleriaceae bacterium]|nr:hypothetical protein [Kofleriaceae bacterium]